MDYLTIARHTARAARAAQDVDDPILQVALRLARYAWQHSTSQGVAAARWDLFGVAVQAVTAKLQSAAPPMTIAVDSQPLPDTGPVRAATAELTEAVAARLEAASGDTHAEPHRRWSWAAAASRLQNAAEQLR
jgi:hypothetical protein